MIITQFDMLRRDTVAHDSIVDQKGRLWYNDQSAPFIGVMDFRANTTEEFPLPEAKDKPFTGASDVEVSGSYRARAERRFFTDARQFWNPVQPDP